MTLPPARPERGSGKDTASLDPVGQLLERHGDITRGTRPQVLDGWLYRYNHHRRLAGIGRQTPITRLNNLLGTYS